MIGKLLGGAFGFVLGGPIGAIAGLALGNLMDQKGKGHLRTPSGLEQNQQYFFVCTFALYGKLAKADGHVSEAEIEQLEKFMDSVFKFDPDARQFAINIFRESIKNQTSFEDYAKQFDELFGHSSLMINNLLASLYVIANCDGHFHPSEKNMIFRIAEIFNVSKEDLNFIFSPFSEGEDKLTKAYNILDLNSDCTDKELKSKYRALVKEFHPDLAIAKGLPEEMISVANTKFAKINDSYEVLSESRGMK